MQGGRLHHSCTETWYLYQARCARNMPVRWLLYQRSSWCFCIASLTAAGRRIKPCPDPGCIVPSRRKAICFKHVGSYGGCWIVGCTSKMVGRLMVCSKRGGKGHSQSLSSSLLLGFLQIPRWCSFGSTTLVLVNAYGVAYTLTLRALVKVDGSGDAPFGRAWLAWY